VANIIKLNPVYYNRESATMIKLVNNLSLIVSKMAGNKKEIEIKNIDHLGIVAGIIDDIGIVQIVNNLLGIDSREKVSCGVVVKAIILNGLGFVSQPLYLFPHFFKDKATEHLLGKGIKAEELNDDRLGRVIDKLYKYGLNKIFSIIALEVVKKYNIATKYSHLDSSSFHLHGQYNNRTNKDTKEIEVIRETPIVITQGYSRDHRPDLKQCILDLIVSNDGDIPLFLRGGSGNEADKAMFGKIFVEYSNQIDFESIMVADCALYSPKNLKLMEKMKWISRVPLSMKKAKNLIKVTTDDKLIKIIKNEKLEQADSNGYSYYEAQVTYAGIEQRWILIESQERKQAAKRKISQKINKERIKAMEKLSKIIEKDLGKKSTVIDRIEKIRSSLKYHNIVKIEFVEKENDLKKIMYSVSIELVENSELIDELNNQAGRFILATNILDRTELSCSDILEVYKEQQSCERGFGFLKDPLFFADSLFVKNPERIETIMMLMGLCLLVYKLGERQIRINLQAKTAFVKNQLNQPTARPTLRWIFQCFQGIHLLALQGVKQIINMSEERNRILEFLPICCQKYYFIA
jgi:transposase